MLILILPVIDHFSASVEQQHLFTLSNPCLRLEGSFQLFPGIFTRPKEIFSDGAAMATPKYLIDSDSDVFIQPQKVEGVMGIFGNDVIGGFQGSKTAGGGVGGGGFFKNSFSFFRGLLLFIFVGVYVYMNVSESVSVIYIKQRG